MSLEVTLKKLIPQYDYTTGGELFTKYIALFQQLINELISANEEIFTIFDAMGCDQKYLPYLSILLGYDWDFEGNIERQRYELASIVERRKRVGTFWYINDLFKTFSITYDLRDLVHKVITTSGPETLDGDYYIQGLEKYHEGSVEIIVYHTPDDDLESIIRSSMPAGVHLHITYSY